MQAGNPGMRKGCGSGHGRPPGREQRERQGRSPWVLLFASRENLIGRLADQPVDFAGRHLLFQEDIDDLDIGVGNLMRKTEGHALLGQSRSWVDRDRPIRLRLAEQQICVGRIDQDIGPP